MKLAIIYERKIKLYVCKNSINIPKTSRSNASTKAIIMIGVGVTYIIQSRPMKVILDFGLEHAGNDKRLYLTVEILGKTVLGLLDSGASRTFFGSKCIELVRELGLQLDTSQTTLCTVGNGNRCCSVGVVSLPISLRCCLGVIEAIVIPELIHILILGQDFWKIMGIVPDLRYNEWHFSKRPVINTIDHIHQQTVLSPIEKSRLQSVIDRNQEMMESEVGCTNRA